MPATMTRDGDQLVIDLRSCRGLEFQDALIKVREIPGRRFDYDNKLWLLPADAQTAERVYMTLRPNADAELIEWIKSARTSASEDLTSPLPDDAELMLPWARKRAKWQPRTVNDEPFNGLFDYQRSAVDLMARMRRILLADDMGSGKTIMALAAVEEHRLRTAPGDGFTYPDGPKLVICPASVKGSWLREIGRYLPVGTEAIVLSGSYPKRVGTKAEHEKLGHRADADGRFSMGISPDEARRLVLMDAIERNAWIIVNWEQIRAKKEVIKTRNGGRRTVVRMKEPLFEETEWLAVIADEIHRAKNRRSQQTRGLHRISGEVMFGLTGTPLMNSPDELWALMRWLWPEDYHELGERHRKGAKAYWTFYELYVEYWEGGFGKVVTGVKNPDALRFELKDRLIRRTASQLRGDDKRRRQRIYYELDLNPRQRRLYDDAVKRMWLEVEQDVRAGDRDAEKLLRALKSGSVADIIKLPNGASRMVRCQQIIESPALLGAEDDSALLDDLVDRVMDTRPFQWVVFTKFKETCDLVKRRLEKKGLTVGVYNGDVRANVRTRLEDQFQAGDIDVMVGTVAAMREGITLTAAHLMHFLTRDWVPDVNDQCEAREDRIGQQNKVTVNIPLARNTVATDNVEPTNRRKEGIVRTVVSKDDIEEVRK